jgi:hypothetical protein
MLAPMWDRPEPVARVRRPDLAAFRADYAERARPVVITGLTDAWPAAERWSPDYFRDAHGALPISAYVMEAGRIVLDAQSGFRLERMTMRDYVDATLESSEPRLYLRARTRELPALERELRVPEYCARGLGLRSNLWFAARGTVSQLHFDLPHNLIAQLYGKKRFLLFSTKDTRALYPHSLRSSTPHLSQVDPERPDFARWPRLRRARPLECVLEPGDALYLPPRFWHHARALEVSISTNFWWCDAVTYPLLLASDLYKRVRGLNI